MPWPRRFYLALFSVLVGASLLWVQQTRGYSLRHPDRTAIEFVSYGDVDGDLLADIARETSQAFSLPCRVSPAYASLPPTGRDAQRGQYDADVLRDQLSASPLEPGTCLIGVTEADLYASGLNFVFGEAAVPGQVAVMSLARLRPRTAGHEINRGLLLDRATKVAIHELGHLMGLGHCADETCVMWFANSTGELDRGGREFCLRCARKLR
jgi:archaemetzincin